MARRRTKYLKVRGSAKYVIRARTKEEAEAILEEMLFDDIERGWESFLGTGIPQKRWIPKAIAGVEARRAKPGEKPRPLDLEWKNHPRQNWIRGKKG